MIKRNKLLLLKLVGFSLLPIITFIVMISLNTVPDIKTVKGQTYTWESEQFTLVNYFAEWCKPCLEELPELNKLAVSEELRVFGVSYDRLENTDILALINDYKIAFPVVTSESLATLPTKLPSVLPTTYLVAPNGKVVDVIRGKVTEQSILTLLNKHQHTL